MKRIMTFTILLLLFQNLFAQDLVGKWNINFLLDNNYPPEEYILRKTKPDKYGIEFGLVLILKSDGTFHSYRNPGCGQDRFPPSTYGKYTIIDDNYISFFLEKRNEEQETLINENLGNYYYYSQKEDGFRLLKSSGNIERDKQIVYFRDLLYKKNIEINQYEDNVLNWEYTELKDQKEAVAFCLSENQAQEFEILYSRRVEGYNRTIILTKIKSKFRYIIFEKDFGEKSRNRIALYDDSKIKESNKLVTKINNDKKLKIKTIEDNDSETTSTLKLYRKKKKIHKAIYNKDTSYSNQVSVNNITIYFKNEEPIYIEYITKHIDEDKKERESITGFYVLNFNNNNHITKQVKKENGKNNYPSGLLIEVMNVINKHMK